MKKSAKNKLTRMLAGVLLAAVTIVSVVGGSIVSVDAKPKTTKCKSSIYLSESVGFYERSYSYKTTKTINMTMCKGCTSNYKVPESPIPDSDFDDGDKPFKIKLANEKHKVTVTSSNPSVVSVKSTLTGSKNNEVYLDAKKCGTATITVKASCGNKYKIKVTVKDHNYKTVKEDYEIYKCCKYCGKTVFVSEKSLIDPNWNPTEEEIYQRIMDIAGEDHVVYGDESWMCEDWTNWMAEKVWGFKGGRHTAERYGKKVKDFSKARCGDIIVMPDHVAMVVKNHHDGYLELASNGIGHYDIGMSDEEYARHCKHLDDGSSYGNSIVPYDHIDSIYTLYND